jgi:hypothetical protein
MNTPNISWNHSDALAAVGFAPSIKVENPHTVDGFVDEVVNDLKAINIRKSKFTGRVRNPYPEKPSLTIQNVCLPLSTEDRYFGGLKYGQPFHKDDLWDSLNRNAEKVYAFYTEAFARLKGFGWSAVIHDIHGLPRQAVDEGPKVLLSESNMLTAWQEWPELNFGVLDAEYRQPFLAWFNRAVEATIGRAIADAALEQFGVRTIGYNSVKAVGADFTTPRLYPDTSHTPYAIMLDAMKKLHEAAVNGPVYGWIATPGVSSNLPSKEAHQLFNDLLVREIISMGGSVAFWNHNATEQDNAAMASDVVNAELSWANARRVTPEIIGDTRKHETAMRFAEGIG